MGRSTDPTPTLLIAVSNPTETTAPETCFAFPTQTLHVAQLDPTAEHKPADIPDTHAERRAVLEGRRLARELTQNQP